MLFKINLCNNNNLAYYVSMFREIDAEKTYNMFLLIDFLYTKIFIKNHNLIIIHVIVKIGYDKPYKKT